MIGATLAKLPLEKHARLEAGLAFYLNPHAGLRCRQ
jgi:hypothetical protein